jgi:hypothetical protein
MANSSKLLTRTRNVALAIAVTAVLAACGGGGGGRRNNPVNPAVGDTFAVTTAGRLLSFNRASGGLQSATAITGLGNDVPIGFDIRPIDGTLIVVGMSGGTGRIYRVNPASGVAVLVNPILNPTNMMPLALTGTTFGADFNPVPDRLRLVSNMGQNLRINLANGVATIDGALTLNGVAANGVTEVGYTNSFGQACRTQLLYLDTANNRLLTTTAPNDGIVTVVGSLGVTTNAAVSGFEVFTDAAGMNTASVVLTVGGIPNVYTINLTTGAVSGAQPIMGLNAAENIVGISAQTTPAMVTQAAGELTGLTSGNAIFTFNSAAPNKVCTGPTNVTGLGMGENVVGIDVRPADSNLYGVGVTPGAMMGDSGTARVFQINRMTGAITAPQTLVTAAVMGTNIPVMGTTFGVDFNPVPDRLRITSDSGLNLRANVDNGVTLTDGPTGGNITAAGYTNSFGPTSAATTTLYTINSMTGTLNIQNPPNDGTQVAVGTGAGNLGIMAGISGVSGFDVNGVNNNAIAGFQVGTATATTLYQVNLMTGAATVYPGGNVGAGVGVGTAPISGTIRGMTFTNNPQVTAVGLTATGNQLVNFSTTTNLGMAANLGTITTTAITGLQGGENVVGLDFRTSANAGINNRLYVLTDQARTYVVDPATGAATMQIMLMANAMDPFAGFMGLTSFGVDFNPAADRLRTISGSTNLRSVLDGVPMLTAGTTFTDTALSRLAPTPAVVAPTITAAAYANSTPGTPLPTSTTLFTMDAVNDALFVQNPPNNGVQVFVGRLGVDATSIAGFDITGPTTALAVLNTATVNNGLYSINLVNGSATLIGSVNAGGGAITGIALPVSATDPAAGVGTTVTAVVGGNMLTQFVSTPAGLTTSAAIPITGLSMMAESIVDIDFRPSTATQPMPAAGMPATPNGVLHGFSNLGNLYSISATGPTAGAATLITLGADPAGVLLGQSGDPFTVVSGVNFGIDFNPMPDRLRVISNTNQNLRINVGNGVTLLDVNVGLPVMPVATQVVAAGYTNAFPLPALAVPPAMGMMAPAPTTVLFDIDIATTTLQRQDPNPNGGVLTQVGRLDPSFAFTANAAFDIVGGENGLALAILQRTGGTPASTAAQSSLYRINLATGQATFIGDIGPAMGPTLLNGLALRLR